MPQTEFLYLNPLVAVVVVMKILSMSRRMLQGSDESHQPQSLARQPKSFVPTFYSYLKTLRKSISSKLTRQTASCRAPRSVEILIQQHSHIIACLNEADQRNLSLTCRSLLQVSEQVYERAPKLVVIGYGSCEIGRGICVIPEIPWPSGVGCHNWWIRENWPPAHRSPARNIPSKRQQRSYYASLSSVVWLCPHVGRTHQELFKLSEEGQSITYTSSDTIQLSCSFPKCALWARHATVAAWKAKTTEIQLRSIVKVYRLRCSDPKSSRSLLIQKLTPDRLREAICDLDLPLCSHLNLGSDIIARSYDPAKDIVLDRSSDFLSYSALRGLESACVKNFCKACRVEGSNTEWGFYSRILAIEEELWLDVELAICRPILNSIKYGAYGETGIHWNLHAVPKTDLSNSVDGWWKWAEKVAKDGYDWRAPLPPQYLQRTKFSLDVFPKQPPSYESLSRPKQRRSVKKHSRKLKMD